MSCGICLESLVSGLEAASAIASCGHVFHTACLRQNPRPACPSCKGRFAFPEALVRIFFASPPIDEARILKLENERLAERLVDLEMELRRVQAKARDAEERIKKLNWEKLVLEKQREEANKTQKRAEAVEEPIPEPREEKNSFRRAFSVRIKKALKRKKNAV
ncbi:hypothetical protein L596_012855 [Steinernema carpocapsae]|uniref:RING-type domain-containing protein n=1 Tax=Steinernema carpocapsae TaxID=34508 RepID=A0A4U5NYB5_STECR|nr:hypothetical protein L596_012855 [Steinernema carpocapsae]